MTIRWTPDGKVDRFGWFKYPNRAPQHDELADALDECVAALQSICRPIPEFVNERQVIAKAALRKLGVEP